MLTDILQDGPYLTETIVSAQFSFKGIQGGVAQRFESTVDDLYLIFGHQFFYVDLSGRDERGQVSFYGRGCHVTAGRDLCNGDTCLV